MMRKIVCVALLAVAALLGTTISCMAANPVADAAAAGSAGTVRAATGTTTGISNNITAPLSQGSGMKTFDNTKTFNAQVSCPSSTAFLTINIQPLGTGDFRVNIWQDLDFDGTQEVAMTLPMSVSGVCSNGFIACSPGTWAGCNYYKWTVASDMRLGLAPQPGLSSLSGCYCINASCGSTLVQTNITQVLRDFGASAVAALGKSDARYSVSEVKVNGPSVYYYGQQTHNCNVPSNTTPGATTNPQTLFGNWTQFGTATATASSLQAADPNSVHNLIKNAYTNVNMGGTVSCSVRRVINCENGVAFLSGLGYTEGINDTCATMASDPNCTLKNEIADGVKTYSNFNPTGLAPVASCTTVTIQRQRSCTASSYMCGLIMYSCPLANGSACNSANICTSIDTYNVCYPQWVAQREYLCQGNQPDFEALRRRVSTVQSSTSDGQSAMSYNDYSKNLKTNSWGYSSGSAALGSRNSFDSCEKSCKIKRPKQNLQVTKNGTMNTQKTNINSFDWVYASCAFGGCPTQPGDIVAMPCQCINEFGNAAVMLQVMRLAAQDMMCTTGALQ